MAVIKYYKAKSDIAFYSGSYSEICEEEYIALCLAQPPDCAVREVAVDEETKTYTIVHTKSWCTYQNSPFAQNTWGVSTGIGVTGCPPSVTVTNNTGPYQGIIRGL